MPTDIPHFDYPFRFGRDGHVATVEQDSPDEVRNCVIAILLTEAGARLDLPEFGRPPVVFEDTRTIPAGIEAALSRWEPRAKYVLTRDEIRDLTQTIHVAPTLGD